MLLAFQRAEEYKAAGGVLSFAWCAEEEGLPLVHNLTRGDVGVVDGLVAQGLKPGENGFFDMGGGD